MPTKSPENTPFLQRPYIDRQMIVVTDDAVAESARDAERAAGNRDNATNWSQIGEVALRLALGATIPSVSLGVEAIRELMRAWSRLRSDGIRLLQVGKSESNLLDFPPGHPREKVVYVGHPTIPMAYYAAADFHRFTFEHKFSEAIDLLIHLGATKLRVERVRGWSREYAGRMSAPLGPAGENVGMKAGGKSQSHNELLFEANLPGTHAPLLPDTLAWYTHEPTWQSIANGRIKFGLQNFSLSVSYDDDFGIHAGLKASVGKSGLDLGGNFEDHEATLWLISGEFGTVSE